MLVEILVAVGIIALLAGLLFAAMGRAVGFGSESATRASLNAVGMALEAYRNDCDSYPVADASDATGGVALTRCLIAPGSKAVDGADGPGFRIGSSRGTVFGPYLDANKFKIDAAGNLLMLDGSPVGYVLVVTQGHGKRAIIDPETKAVTGYVDDFVAPTYKWTITCNGQKETK